MDGMKQGYIYQLTDGVKTYVGSTFDVERRFEQHKQDSKTGTSKLYKYMRETNLSDWKINVLAKPMILYRFNHLRMYEDEWILRFDSIANGLNERRAECDKSVEGEEDDGECEYEYVENDECELEDDGECEYEYIEDADFSHVDIPIMEPREDNLL
jgi:hypothetical protein